MTFRKIDYYSDLDQIINLLKSGLDQKFSKSFFLWKHIDNPFGNSLGFVVEDKKKIVGLRMFMKWEFVLGNEIFRALRPVDTVVHTNYRGQGLFRELNQRGIEASKGKYKLIFNTPNMNSLPGNLKMGWKQMEDIGFFRLGILNPIKRVTGFEFIKISEIPKENRNNDTLETNHSSGYWEWRYRDNKYNAGRFGDAYMIYSKIKLKKLPAIIIYEIFGSDSNCNNLLYAVGKYEHSYIIYFYENYVTREKLKFLYTIKREKAVVVKLNNGFHHSINFSLGDLEAKL